MRRKSKKKTNFIFRKYISIVIFAIVIFLSITEMSFASWIGVSPASASRQTSVLLGQWLYEVLVYNPAVPRNYNVGEVVLRIVPDTGEEKFYICILNVGAGDPYNDPLIPDLSNNGSLKYLECSRYYSQYNLYYEGDYVMYNGLVYRYNRKQAHNPKTNQSLPTDTKNWAIVTNPPTNPEPFYILQVYFAGSRVNYNGVIYECTEAVSTNHKPDATPTKWVRVN